MEYADKHNIRVTRILYTSEQSPQFHKYDDVCWERDEDQIEARRRVDVETLECRDIGEEEQQRDGPVPPHPHTLPYL